MKNFWPSKGFKIGFLLLVLVPMALAVSGYRVNMTASHPKGLYRLVSAAPERGDYVAFCLAPEHPLADLAVRRGYLGRGGCRSGSRPLLKRLAGLPGDHLALTASGLVLNGLPLSGTARPEADSFGRDLPPSLLTSGLIPAGLALVLSQGHPGSFDSRYFGLVPLATLMKAEPVLIFNKERK
ncbi:MAG: conjugative transfer signal peptidase TraF [Deltaproteobacteria bacterium]|nr:conjugative transfer signal peptidase TraF [Deltaproteobacteria bacterium]